MGPGYLWGPAGAVADSPPVRPRRAADTPYRAPEPVRANRGPRSIGGLVFLLALIAGGLGTGLSWHTHPFGTSLQFGLAAALAVFGAGMVVSAFLGRTGFGTVLLAMITAALLAGAAALPKDISTHWVREEWRPASVAAVQPRYELGTGVGTLDLSKVPVPKGDTVRTRLGVGAGRAVVVVPKAVTLRVRADAGIGDIRLPGDPPGDVDISPSPKEHRMIAPPAGVTPAGTVELDLEVGIGQVEVIRAAS